MATYTATKKENLSNTSKATRFIKGYQAPFVYSLIAKSNTTSGGGQASSDEFPTAYGYL